MPSDYWQIIPTIIELIIWNFMGLLKMGNWYYITWHARPNQALQIGLSPLSLFSLFQRDFINSPRPKCLRTQFDWQKKQLEQQNVTYGWATHASWGGLWSDLGRRRMAAGSNLNRTLKCDSKKISSLGNSVRLSWYILDQHCIVWQLDLSFVSLLSYAGQSLQI